MILVDMVMPGDKRHRIFRCSPRGPDHRDIPAIVVTAKALGLEDRERLSTRAAVLSKADMTKESVCSSIQQVLAKDGPVRRAWMDAGAASSCAQKGCYVERNAGHDSERRRR